MKNKSYLFILPVFIFGAWFATQAISPDKGPHNGTVKPAGDYYIEAGFNSEQIFAFLLDSSMNALGNDGMTCIAIIEFPDKTVGNLDLYPYGKDGFGAPLIDRNYENCTIIFEKNGKKVSAEFPNGALVVMNKVEQ